MMFAPTCFILPVSWHRHEGNIRSCVDRHDEDMRSCFDALCRRNRTLQIRSLEQCRQVGKSDRQQIIVLLDGLFIEQNFRTVAGSCLRVTSNSDVLVKTCIEWATSIYRHGDSRLYASARLLRIWNRHGVEIQRPILDFLASSPNPAGLHKKNIYRLLAELARSQHFSVGQYLQWLIARGALHQHHELEQVSINFHRIGRQLTILGGPM